ncbi:hypothetical protein [Streptomyces albidoflavus]|uniref:hypothetical protein n=1 Tax=Streptomyces albidoflavus TaxID=1886 RepID=UPI0033D1B383
MKAGWWPEGTAAPISVVYDPDNPSWQKAIAYEMDSENVPVFRAAFARLSLTPQAPRTGNGAGRAEKVGETQSALTDEGENTWMQH